MQKSSVILKDIKLIGICVRTSFQNETNPATAKITPTVGHYMFDNIAEQIPNRKNPGVTYCCYTDYEDEYRAGYTYFIGEEVSAIPDLPSHMSSLLIPAGNYSKFTTESGVMPIVLIAAWQKIWLMGEEGIGGKRRYAVDFEVYDKRAHDPKNTVLDVYVGLD